MGFRIVTTALVGIVSFAGRASVLFEFKDATPEGDPNSITIHPGQQFEFDIWLHATANEHVAGVSFLTRFEQYSSTAPATFTFVPFQAGVVMLDRGTSPFTDLGNTPGSGSDLALIPDNANDLGALVPFGDSTGWRTGDVYIGRATLQADSSLPLTSPGSPYLIRPNSLIFSWTEAGDGSHVFDGYTGYQVNVVPEPSEYALAGATGLLGFAAYRRFSRRQGCKS